MPATNIRVGTTVLFGRLCEPGGALPAPRSRAGGKRRDRRMNVYVPMLGPYAPRSIALPAVDWPARLGLVGAPSSPIDASAEPSAFSPCSRRIPRPVRGLCAPCGRAAAGRGNFCFDVLAADIEAG